LKVETFIREAWAASERQKALEDAAARERVRDQEAAAAEAQRLRRNAASSEYAVSGAGIGAVLGGIVMGFSGCVSCLTNSRSQHVLVTDFNLFSGLLWGAIGGVVIGVIVGILIGQTKD
jgi:F0F1-type ATP synthase assembly protein I